MGLKYLVIAPQLGFNPDGSIIPGGLLSFGRSVIRALASCKKISRLGVWCQLDQKGVENYISQMLSFYSHPHINIDIRCFGGNEIFLAAQVAKVSLLRNFDRVMYLLVNQSILGLIPWHLPYAVWEIGEELFVPVSNLKLIALNRSSQLLSISENTSKVAAEVNPIDNRARVVHLCVEPPIYSSEPQVDPITQVVYDPRNRKPVVLIVANQHKRLLYKGHQELIDGWKFVLEQIPNAELWIVGDGDGRYVLEEFWRSQPKYVQEAISFKGRVSDTELDNLYRQVRAFAMPSSGEGFGLVFVEASRYGLPCIGGKNDGVKEIITDGVNGLLVEKSPYSIAQACIQLLRDDELANRFGAAARTNYLNNYRFSHFRERLLKALELEV